MTERRFHQGPERKFSDETLVALRDLGFSKAEAARRIGVHHSAVCRRVIKAGIEWPDVWVQLDEALFARMWSCHSIATREIAKWAGLSRRGVSDRAHRMGLPSRAGVRFKRVRDDELEAMWLAGVSVREIADYFEVSLSAVRMQARRRSLPLRLTSNGRRQTPVGRISLQEFLEVSMRERLEAGRAAAEAALGERMASVPAFVRGVGA